MATMRIRRSFLDHISPAKCHLTIKLQNGELSVCSINASPCRQNFMFHVGIAHVR
eukprot:CAMPEP_0197644300 /NCGR_PEP_ID=MMETSP1338-20131121/17319_1 /TAXON_ID=43686 ORGANISM="Pelagodinium beii, Strain RCC1491" /NCGR_SAMPLE_ID=MMETSP1338 /ASSEMBLY_ACC=CAM_ASM_000754 /LENGTH=54 /DNA_ID=CAMNT_0043217671 /DNA_START=172 /DNA_END=333 /DNA_ORIENTATION=-